VTGPAATAAIIELVSVRDGLIVDDTGRRP